MIPRRIIEYPDLLAWLAALAAAGPAPRLARRYLAELEAVIRARAGR